jgi:hypothetical protein
MSDLPRTRELLAELLKLEDADRQLPLPILVNLHRAQLRTPFEGLVVLARRHQVSPLPVPTGEALYDAEVVGDVMADALVKLGHELRQRYPALGDGKLFDREALTALDVKRLEVEHAECVGPPQGLWDDALVDALFQQQRAEWEAFETVALLHRLTWGRSATVITSTLALLEAELALDEAAARIVHDMAALAY